MQYRGKDQAATAPPPDQQVGEEEAARMTARADAELAHAQDQARRALADLDNYRKRFERELERLRAQDRETLLRDLLPVVDNLERALATADLDAPISRAGIEAVHRQLLGVLKRYGVETVEAKGKPYEPEWHEVIGTAQTGANEGTVTEVTEPGYRMGAHCLRPARVIVEKLGMDT